MHTKQQSGFSLVELAVVVFLIGMIATMGITALKSQLISASTNATKRKQDTIKDALITYLGRNKRLPCPAIDNSGNESRNTANTPANCTGYFGVIPYSTLGLTKSAALDGWENFFSYAVTPQWTLTYSSATPVAGGVTHNNANLAFNVGDEGGLTINDRLPATNPSTTLITSKAAIALISHGSNGLGALTTKGTWNSPPPSGTDESANVPNPSTWVVPPAYYQREYTDADVPTYGVFDDVLQWHSANDLIIPLIRDGALKSPESQWSDQVTNINNALIGDMFLDSRCAPVANQTEFEQLLDVNNIPKIDPWGGTFIYTQNFCRLHDDGRYKTSSCWSDCGGGGCITNSATRPYSITLTTPGLTFTGKTLGAIIASNSNLLNNCPNP